MKSKRTRAIEAGLLIALILQGSPSHAASSSAINSAYKQMYRKLADQGNTLGIAAMTYYDVQVKQAIGKILDHKISCDTKSKNRYKNIAFDSSQSEVNQFVYGIYLGWCNSQ